MRISIMGRPVVTIYPYMAVTGRAAGVNRPSHLPMETFEIVKVALVQFTCFAKPPAGRFGRCRQNASGGIPIEWRMPLADLADLVNPMLFGRVSDRRCPIFS